MRGDAGAGAPEHPLLVAGLVERVQRAIERGHVEPVAIERGRRPHFARRVELPDALAVLRVDGVHAITLRAEVQRVAIDRDAADDVVARVADPARVPVAHVEREHHAAERCEERGLVVRGQADVAVEGLEALERVVLDLHDGIDRVAELVFLIVGSGAGLQLVLERVLARPRDRQLADQLLEPGLRGLIDRAELVDGGGEDLLLLLAHRVPVLVFRRELPVCVAREVGARRAGQREQLGLCATSTTPPSARRGGEASLRRRRPRSHCDSAMPPRASAAHSARRRGAGCVIAS
jgi:hypothetical protein